MTVKPSPALLAALLLVGCSTEYFTTWEPRCTTADERERLAKFVIDCSAAANPKSDEEGEDLVAECLRSGITVICPYRTVHWKRDHHADYPKERKP